MSDRTNPYAAQLEKEALSSLASSLLARLNVMEDFEPLQLDDPIPYTLSDLLTESRTIAASRMAQAERDGWTFPNGVATPPKEER